MRIKLKEGSFLELGITGKGTTGVPYSCSLRATLVSDICGGNKEFYVDGDEAKTFMKDLNNVSASLKGFAELQSESPRDFTLRIAPVDSLGHFALSISIGHQFFIGSETFLASTANSFSVESQELERVCKQLVAFFKEVENA